MDCRFSILTCVFAVWDIQFDVLLRGVKINWLMGNNTSKINTKNRIESDSKKIVL